MSEERPIRHGAVIERLWRATVDGRLPHALMLEGREGTGRFLAARWFARGLLCDEGPGWPCGSCGPCKRVLKGMHADLNVIDAKAEGEERILLGRIARRSQESRPKGPRGAAPLESIEAFMDLRPVESGWRLVLLRECHRMNTSAQNALLKTLEEPRPGNILLLETHRPARLLPTILSRCVRVRFDELDAGECSSVLQQSGFDGSVAKDLARWSGGSPGVSLTWHSQGVAEFLRLLRLVLEGRGALRVAPDLWGVEGEFVGNTPTAQARERARFVLELTLGIVRDALRRSAGLPADELPMGEFADELAQVGESALRRVLAELLEARADVDRNLAPEAVLERGLLALARPIQILTRSSAGGGR